MMCVGVCVARARDRAWHSRMVTGGEVSDDMKIASFPAC